MNSLTVLVLQHVGAEAGRVRGQVDGQEAAVEQPGGRVAVAVAGAEPLRAERFGQRADGAEAVVVDQDDVQLDALGDRGDDLGRHHQVGPVADEHEDLAARIGQLGAQAAGDLVPHARVAVLDVVLLRVPGAPQHLQVPGHAPGRLHHHVPLVHELVQRAEDLGLRRKRLMTQVVGVVHHLLPAGVLGSRSRRCTPRRRGSRLIASVRASRPARASATRATPACLPASNAATLRLTNLTSGFRRPCARRW